MHLAGDLMMTKALSMLRKCGASKVYVKRGGVITGVVTSSPLYNMIGWCSGGAQRRIKNANDKVKALMSSEKAFHEFQGRTFRQTIAFRTERFFDEQEAEMLCILPARYEIIKVR